MHHSYYVFVRYLSNWNWSKCVGLILVIVLIEIIAFSELCISP